MGSVDGSQKDSEKPERPRTLTAAIPMPNVTQKGFRMDATVAMNPLTLIILSQSGAMSRIRLQILKFGTDS